MTAVAGGIDAVPFSITGILSKGRNDRMSIRIEFPITNQRRREKAEGQSKEIESQKNTYLTYLKNPH